MKIYTIKHYFFQSKRKLSFNSKCFFRTFNQLRSIYVHLSWEVPEGNLLYKTRCPFYSALIYIWMLTSLLSQVINNNKKHDFSLVVNSLFHREEGGQIIQLSFEQLHYYSSARQITYTPTHIHSHTDTHTHTDSQTHTTFEQLHYYSSARLITYTHTHTHTHT